MLCPNCKEKLFEDVADDQNILHCSNCGSTYFQENGINRISLDSAQKLASDLKENKISGEQKICPRDNSVLSVLPTGENIPNDVTLLHCPTCKGILAYANDLVLFKKAQEAKIDYFKIWNIPLPSIRSVAILSIFLFVSILSLTAYNFFQKQNIYFIQADEQVSNIFVTTSNRYLFVSFKTLTPLKTRIIFYDRAGQTTLEKSISEEPNTFHQLTTGDINIDSEIYYEILLIDKTGNQIRTEMKRLEIK